MGQGGGKRARKVKEDGIVNKIIPTIVKTPKSRGIGHIPKARTPSTMRIAAAAMPSSEVAVSKI